MPRTFKALTSIVLLSVITYCIILSNPYYVLYTETMEDYRVYRHYKDIWEYENKLIDDDNEWLRMCKDGERPCNQKEKDKPYTPNTPRSEYLNPWLEERPLVFFSVSLWVFVGFLIYAIAITGVLMVNNFYHMAVPIVLYGFANGINIPSTQTLLAELIDMKYRGAFMSINAMVLRIGQTLGPILAGFVFAWQGINGIFYGAILFSVTIFMFISMGLRKELRR